MKILNSREKKNILNWLKIQYGIKELKINKIFLKNNKDKIYLINKEITQLDEENLRINLIGMYFAKKEKGSIRLSIEGSQIIGPKATKNIIELNKKQIKEWLQGNSINIVNNYLEGFIILKFKDDFYGIGNYKEGKILNYIPKERRIRNVKK